MGIFHSDNGDRGHRECATHRFVEAFLESYHSALELELELIENHSPFPVHRSRVYRSRLLPCKHMFLLHTLHMHFTAILVLALYVQSLHPPSDRVAIRACISSVLRDYLDQYQPIWSRIYWPLAGQRRQHLVLA